MLEITDDVINDAGYDKKELSGKNVSVFTGARIWNCQEKCSQKIPKI
jgi:acyl transferase domain-containing protein